METRTSFGSNYPIQPSLGANYPADSPGLSSIRSAPLTSKDSISLGRQPRMIREKVRLRSLSKMSLLMKVGRVTEIASWVVGGTSLFALGILILTPILLPLLTFGGCFAEGFGGWVEFAGTALSMSFTPAWLTGLSIATAYGAKKLNSRLSHQLAQQQRDSHELRALEKLIKPTVS